MVTIQLYNDTYQVPEKWEELTLKELLYLSKLTTKEVPAQKLKLQLFLYHLNARVVQLREADSFYSYQPDGEVKRKIQKSLYEIKIGRKSYGLTAEQLTRLSDLYDFLIKDDKNGNYHLTPELLHNPYPTFKIWWNRFTGPDEYMYEITFNQYVFLTTYLDRMSEDHTAINYVLACAWYRGKSWKAENIEKDANLLSRLPDAQKMVMYWFVSSCLSDYANQYPRLFNESGKSSGMVFDNQQRLINTLANGDLTKKEEVRHANILDAFYTMDEAIRMNEEREMMMKR
ncbi:MAG: hypothetical protein ACRC3Z_11165 [Phocaeicola sp.]